MPLVVMCGLPSSGKSRRVTELVEYLKREHPTRRLHIVSDEGKYDKNIIFSTTGDSKRELEQRGYLRSETQRLISRDDIVILDSMNYIKGYRYELFCIAKACQTPHCVLHVDPGVELARKWNEERSSGGVGYAEAVFDELCMRFEPPVSMNRWDSPLFTVSLPEAPLPCEEIVDALLHRRAPPPNMSTRRHPTSPAHFLHDVNSVSQQIVTQILEEQRVAGVWPPGRAPQHSDEKLNLQRPYSMGELRKLKQQFISYSKTRPDMARLEGDRVGTMFVKYLNNSAASS